MAWTFTHTAHCSTVHTKCLWCGATSVPALMFKMQWFLLGDLQCWGATPPHHAVPLELCAKHSALWWATTIAITLGPGTISLSTRGGSITLCILSEVLNFFSRKYHIYCNTGAPRERKTPLKHLMQGLAGNVGADVETIGLTNLTRHNYLMDSAKLHPYGCPSHPLVC